MRKSWIFCALAVGVAASSFSADRSAPRRRKPDPDHSIPATPLPVTESAPAPKEPVAAPKEPVAGARALPTVTPTMSMSGEMQGAAPLKPAGPPGKAEIPELAFDAGSVERGTEIKHDFVIKSTGTNDLTIDAKPGCGCTVVDYAKVVKPGESGTISAAVHTTNFKGAITKSITVTTNDPENPRFTLAIKANVTVPVDVSPGENLAFNGKAGSLSPQEVTVSSVGGETFDITGVTAADPSFTATVVAAPATGAAPHPAPGTVASGSNTYKVRVTPSKDIPVGRVSSSILLKTTHPKAGEITLRMFGNVAGEVEVVPQYVTLSTGATATPEAKVQHAVIKKATGDPLKIMSVTSDNPKVETRLTTVTEGREYDLQIKYTGEPMITALASKIAVTTNDPRQPKVEIQIWGRVDPGMRPPMVSANGSVPGTAAPLSVHPAQAQAAPTP
jgi:hypothetical protein